MNAARASLAGCMLGAVWIAACSGQVNTSPDHGDSGAKTDGGSSVVNAPASPEADANGALDADATSEGAASPPAALFTTVHASAIDKVDLLFMIDNSPSMGDKQALLAAAVPDLISRLVTPRCLAADGTVLGSTDMNGRCASGTPEFAAVHDMHIGIVTSSLGGRGGNVCPTSDVNAANPRLSAHNDDQGHLINRGGADEHDVARADPENFLAWFPPVGANSGQATPPNAETQVGASGQPGTLIGDFTDMVSGVHEHGCGFEAQNEAWYRFLVQPDPFGSIAVSSARASLVGLDSVILQQRAAFLRPDSLLAVIVVTDENEEVADPLSVGGQGWLLEQFPWPSSPSGGAPEATIECAASGPDDPNCTSCAFASVQSSANFAARCPTDPPAGVDGYLDPSDDQINVRFFDQKQRFGIFAGYPVSRYVRGLTSPIVPDRNHEVDGEGTYVGDQDAFSNCVNPIYAQDLASVANVTDPTSPSLCALQRGPRTPDMVFYGAIAGVPHELLQARPGDPECPAGTASADCPQKEVLTSQDWTRITGADPENYDFTGADVHMLEATAPRAGSQCSPESSDDCDPIVGREWDTRKGDLQFACVFPLVDPSTGAPAPKDCTSPAFTGACDCVAGAALQSTPLCQKSGGAYTTTQVQAKAYPSIREMEIAHALATSPAGVQGVVSSLCPIHTSFAGGDPNDPLFGYRPALGAIVQHLGEDLQVGCLPQPLPTVSDGIAACDLLVTLAGPGDEKACESSPGLAVPPAEELQALQAAQHQAWLAGGSAGADPSASATCLVRELDPALEPQDFENGSCAGTTLESGWCYVTSPSTTGCAATLAFTADEPPRGATVTLACKR